MSTPTIGYFLVFTRYLLYCDTHSLFYLFSTFTRFFSGLIFHDKISTTENVALDTKRLWSQDPFYQRLSINRESLLHVSRAQHLTEFREWAEIMINVYCEYNWHVAVRSEGTSQGDYMCHAYPKTYPTYLHVRTLVILTQRYSKNVIAKWSLSNEYFPRWCNIPFAIKMLNLIKGFLMYHLWGNILLGIFPLNMKRMDFHAVTLFSSTTHHIYKLSKVTHWHCLTKFYYVYFATRDS